MKLKQHVGAVSKPAHILRVKHETEKDMVDCYAFFRIIFQEKSMISFELKKKKYNWSDFLRVPFQCDPVATTVLGFQKLTTALTEVLQVPIIAKFIDVAINSVNGEIPLRANLPWFLILLLCVGWRRISWASGNFFTKRLNINAITKMGLAFADKQSKLEYRHLENADTWNLINRVSKNVDPTINTMLQRFYNIMVYTIRILGVVFLVFSQIWWVGIVASAFCILIMLISMRSGKINYETLKATDQYERRHKYLAEVLSGREAVDERSLFDYSKYVGEQWYEQYENFRKVALKASIALSINTKSSAITTTILSSALIIALIFPTVSGQISVGMFIALATSMYGLISMVGQELPKAVLHLAKFNAYLKDLTIFAALSETEGTTDLPEKRIETFETLEFRNVRFQYPNTNTMILNGVNFKMEKGRRYAFVGANGAGKTTIIKILIGLYDNYEGEVILNGKNLKEYLPSQLKAMICGLYQDFAKYFITVRENLVLGDINAINDPNTIERAEHFLKELNIYQEMSDLPQGLDTPLGKILEGGVDLSGGQWQKLAMTRTLMNPAPLLILDEPTAALDPISESNLYELFNNVSRDRTTILISHRLGSTTLVDCIFVLNNGKVVENGTHQELMTQKGEYAKMYKSQMRWYI